MAANISIYFHCPDDWEGPDRWEFEELLEAFFGDAAEVCGAGVGETGFNLDYELEDGEDPRAWAERHKPFFAEGKWLTEEEWLKMAPLP